VSARKLDGRGIADQVLDEVRATVAARTAGRRPPLLAAVLVGDDPASQVYVQAKIQACARCGIDSRRVALPGDVASADVRVTLERLGSDALVDGILLQLPLPAGLDAAEALASLAPSKDVDGLHPLNAGKLATDDDSGFVPCTPAGVVELLRRSDIPIAGRRVVVLGRSHLVGRPLALLLLRRGADATVTVAHSRSRELPALVREAEILVAAVGRPRFVQPGWLRPGAVVVDVGIHREPHPDRPGGMRLIGDVEGAERADIAAYTPVPGGVGPMTVAMLLRNTLLAWQRRHEGS
jgi:methylenetetrahydrofolate dehydrogenase (NADP+)/methenyltetrahydrofolate cyclohydrolase